MTNLNALQPTKLETQSDQTDIWRLAMWDVTYYCNLSCKHCYNTENVVTDKNAKSALSLAKGKSVIDNLVQLGFSEVNLAGGEPLSHPNVYKLIEYVLSAGIVPSVNTNGLLLTQDLADKLISLKFSNLSISLAGITEHSNSLIRGKNTLKKITSNLHYFIDQISRQGIKNNISINFSVLRTNIDELPELYKFCHDLGVASANVHLTQPMGAAVHNVEFIEFDYKNTLDGFENLIMSWGPEIRLTLDTRPIAAEYLCKKYRLPKPQMISNCPAGDRNVYVQPDGQMLACKLLSISNQYVGGGQQITPPDIGAISIGDPTWKKRAHLPSICSNCRFNRACSPCPLLTHGERISECEVALAANSEYDSNVLGEILYKSVDAYETLTHKGQTVIFNKGRKFKLSESGHFIWQNISINKSILDVIELTRAQISNTSQEEIIEFIHNLRRMGLVSFINDFPFNLPINNVLICCAR